MKKNYLNIFVLTSSLIAVTATGCKKDYKNPNQATTDQIFASDRGATAVAVGLQKVYSVSAASSLYALVNANGFVTKELILRNAGNIPELQLSTGGSAVDGTNTVLNNVWTKSSKIIFDADNVIRFANGLGDKSYASGLISYASIFKALSIGNLAMFWEKVPDTTGQNVGFINRVDGYKKAVAVLNNAIAAYTAAAPSTAVLNRLQVQDATTKVYPIDILNTLYALKARYSLFAGDYATALSAANQVDLTKTSVLTFDALNQNPVFESATATNNVFQPVDTTLGLPKVLEPNVADKRIPFYVGINTSIAPRYRIKGFYASGTTAVPIYLPGEMLLIKAEAYARQDKLPEALIELNKVITKKPSEDAFGVGADLTPIVGPLTKDQILTEIYRQRSIELFMSGLRLEDMRRLARPLEERKRNFFPYPFQERDNNPNTPADPTF
ncbi:RagB/SusD family nutrient uptake outer membrane protein [Flavisolibacter tropicus]|uniref:RagB/SusD family protein n=1 Tax=Flavisolibacter tropicus TaxID=1492898 RepID=A0A172U0K1_9BACT|nr:RagB/SusD family nutrient uptake outer membrane protein [Flavisolibacter tropicus]ANE52752.1 RagB/SusD family protein [Flavisolibacter tropicus]